MRFIILLLANLVAIAIGEGLDPYACSAVLVRTPGVRCGDLGNATHPSSKGSVIESRDALYLRECGALCLGHPECKTTVFVEGECVLYRDDGDELGWTYTPGDNARIFNKACFVFPDPCFYLQVDAPGTPIDNSTIRQGVYPNRPYYPAGFDRFPGLYYDYDYFTITDGVLVSLFTITGNSIMTYTPVDSMLNLVNFTPRNESQGLAIANCSVDPTLNVINFQDAQGNPLQSQSCVHYVNGYEHRSWFLASPGVTDPTFCEVEDDIQLLVINGTRT